MLSPISFSSSWNSCWKLHHSLHLWLFRKYLVFHSPYLIYTLHLSVVSLYLLFFLQVYLIYYLLFVTRNLGKPYRHLMIISYAQLKSWERKLWLINVYLDHCSTRNTPLLTCGILPAVLRILFVASNYGNKKCFIFWRYIKNIGTSALQRQNYKPAALKIIVSATEVTSCYQMVYHCQKKNANLLIKKKLRKLDQYFYQYSLWSHQTVVSYFL